MTEVNHTDVGAYALGLLEHDDERAFEQHLRDCPTCAAEMAELGGMKELLTGIPPETADPSAEQDVAAALRAASPGNGAVLAPAGTAVPDPERQSHGQQDGGEQQRRAPVRGARVLVGVAAAGLVVLGFLGGLVLNDDSDGTLDAFHGPAGQLIVTGERYTASNRATGVSGVIGLEEKAWGSHIALELRGVKGPLTCRLVAVDGDGDRRDITSWQVPAAGYGVPGSWEPLMVHGGTPTPPGDLERLEVRTDAGKTLLRVPV